MRASKKPPPPQRLRHLGPTSPADQALTARDVVQAHYRAQRVAERRITTGSIETVAIALARLFGGRSRAARVARRWERDTSDARFGLVARCLEHAAVA